MAEAVYRGAGGGEPSRRSQGGARPWRRVGATELGTIRTLSGAADLAAPRVLAHRSGPGCASSSRAPLRAGAVLPSSSCFVRNVGPEDGATGNGNFPDNTLVETLDSAAAQSSTEQSQSVKNTENTYHLDVSRYEETKQKMPTTDCNETKSRRWKRLRPPIHTTETKLLTEHCFSRETNDITRKKILSDLEDHFLTLTGHWR
jgi:hypothetical protein